jgi:hypothetical protein
MWVKTHVVQQSYSLVSLATRVRISWCSASTYSKHLAPGCSPQSTESRSKIQGLQLKRKTKARRELWSNPIWNIYLRVTANDQPKAGARYRGWKERQKHGASDPSDILTRAWRPTEEPNYSQYRSRGRPSSDLGTLVLLCYLCLLVLTSMLVAPTPTEQPSMTTNLAFRWSHVILAWCVSVTVVHTLSQRIYFLE